MIKYSTSGYAVHSALGRALLADSADECAKLLADARTSSQSSWKPCHMPSAASGLRS